MMDLRRSGSLPSAVLMHAAADVGKRAAALIDNPETGYAQTGIYAEDTDICYLPIKTDVYSYSSITAVV